jgi:integrase|tara:strand:- start:142 stop:1785 length:1644 start_codon:yes stop_codon:yes gene_type:complete
MSKLCNKLETKPDTTTGNKTGNKRSLDYSNAKIEKFSPTFGTARHIYVPFKVPHGSHLKGLCLRVSKLKGFKTIKRFVLRYWLEGKHKKITLGIFKPGFGIKEINDKLYQIVKEHTNEKGLWIKSPNITEYEKEHKITKSQFLNSQKKTAIETIELICKAGFPKITKTGNLTAKTISQCFRFLAGYNWRARHLKFQDDKEGNGVITFRKNMLYSRRNKRTRAVKNFDELFKKFPPGEHVLKKVKHFNPSGNISLYDDPVYGKMLMENFSTGAITRYISTRKEYGTKKNLLGSIKVLWGYAKDVGLLGDSPGRNPTLDITLKRPTVMKNKASVYNDKIFTLKQLEDIQNACLLLAEKFPFQAEMILMLMFTGRRQPELSKIRRTNIKLAERIIVIPATTHKIRHKDQFITITDPVAMVLDMLNKKKDRVGYEKFKFIPWLFPTVRFDSNEISNPGYLNGESTKLKSISNCWNELRKMKKIWGSPKMFRKTFSSLAKDTLGNTGKATKLTGHEQDSTLDKFYYRTHKEVIIEDADKVAKIFNFPKVVNN